MIKNIKDFARKFFLYHNYKYYLARTSNIDFKQNMFATIIFAHVEMDLVGLL